MFGLLTSLGIKYHIYADDIALFIEIDMESFNEKLDFAAYVFDQIRLMLSTLKLKVNSDKKQCMFVSNDRSSIFPDCINLGNTEIKLTKSLRLLGVIFDNKMSFSNQVNSVCSSCYFQLKKISAIRMFIDPDLTKLLIINYVLSRLDYCNSILYGIRQFLIIKLQRVQNRAARLIYLCNKTVSAGPLLSKLHWLTIEKRIIFKIACFMHRIYNGLPIPVYLAEGLTRNDTTRQRENELNTFEIVKTKNSFGDRSFLTTGRRIWNSLPNGLRMEKSRTVFRKNLKTHLF